MLEGDLRDKDSSVLHQNQRCQLGKAAMQGRPISFIDSTQSSTAQRQDVGRDDWTLFPAPSIKYTILEG